MDCRKAWELLATRVLKSSKLAGDRGLIIRKIIGPENKSKIEFDYAHVKTKNVDDNSIINKGLTMVLGCDTQEKVKRWKCTRENVRDHRLVVGNVKSQ